MDNLPTELIIEILLPLDTRSILRYCRASKALQLVCQSDYFWSRKAELSLAFPQSSFIRLREEWRRSPSSLYQTIGWLKNQPQTFIRHTQRGEIAILKVGMYHDDKVYPIIPVSRVKEAIDLSLEEVDIPLFELLLNDPRINPYDYSDTVIEIGEVELMKVLLRHPKFRLVKSKYRSDLIETAYGYGNYEMADYLENY